MKLITELKSFRFYRHFTIKSFACFGFLSGVIQLLIVFHRDLDKVFQGSTSFAIVTILCLIVGTATSWPRQPKMEYNAPKTKITIVKGDILDQPDHIAVGVCDTFDTAIPTIISNSSLLGQTIHKLFGGDVAHLNSLLSAALTNISVVGQIHKSGNTNQYPIGTVAVVRHDPRLIFFVAYCQMNTRNEASGTIDSVWNSLNSLWEAVSVRANHAPIAVPVIGGGSARMSHLLPAQDAIRLIALSFMFASRKAKVSDELKIVVLPSDYDRLDLLELQSFLSALRPS